MTINIVARSRAFRLNTSQSGSKSATQPIDGDVQAVSAFHCEAARALSSSAATPTRVDVFEYGPDYGAAAQPFSKQLVGWGNIFESRSMFDDERTAGAPGPSANIIRTAHAECRMRQRGIPQSLLQAVLDNADVELPVGRGCVSLAVSRRCTGSLHDLDRSLFDRLPKLCVVLGDDGCIVTVYRRTHRWKRGSRLASRQAGRPG